MKVFLCLLSLFAFLSAQTNQMNIDGKPEKSSSEMVGVRDDNGRICAMIKVVSDMDGFSYDSYNGVVKVDDKPGEDRVYLQPDERVLEIYRNGFEPLKLILSEIGIQLKSKEVWTLRISGEDKLNQLPVVLLSRPEGAHVFIDGKDKGISEKQDLSSGTHNIRLVKQGYEPIIKTIQVDKNNTLFKYDLKKIEDVLVQITSVPSGATVYIDNVKFGTTPLADFYPSGKYPIRIEYDWYVTYEDFIEINSPESKKNYIMSKDFGSLTVNSSPKSGLDIYVNGQLFKYKTPHTFNRLKPGTYQINARSQYYETEMQTIEIKRGVDQKINLTSSGNFAILNIKTDPGVLIYLNNERITNFKDIRLEPSVVKVRAERPPKGKPVEKRIVLKKGDNRDIEIRPEIASGTIQVAVVPFDANITLKGDAGEIFTSGKSKVFKNIPVGVYDITIKKQGFLPQTETVVLSENKTIKRNYHLDASNSGASSSYVSPGKSAQTSGGVHPVFMSMVMPGWGQVHYDHKRGYLYMVSFIGAAAWYFTAYSAHSSNMNDYNVAKTDFELYPSYENLLTVNENLGKAKESYDTGKKALYIMGGVYAVNLLDAMIFSSTQKTSKTYSVKPRIKRYGSDATADFLFGLTINW